MKSIEKALSEYLDSLCSNTQITMKDFELCMSSADYSEFSDLVAFIDFIEESKQQNQDLIMFNKINTYKKSLYDLPAVTNFRTESSEASEDAKKVIDSLFSEEFDDE